MPPKIANWLECFVYLTNIDEFTAKVEPDWMSFIQVYMGFDLRI